MKNMIRNTIFAAAVVAVLASTSAMAATLNVPFSFVAGGKQCPAGTYTVQRGINGGVVTLTSREGSRNFTWVLSPGDPAPDDKAVVMHFETQGDTHVLDSIQYQSQVTSSLAKKTSRTEYPAVSVSAGQGQ